MTRRIFTAMLVAVLYGAACCVHAAKKPEMQRVYMFGFGASFTDSIACQTAIQQLDSAWLEPGHNFLVDRSLYGLQLQYYMESREGCKNAITSIFFDKNPRKLQRVWNRVNRRYKKAEGLQFREVPQERFRFRAEQYHPIIEGDLPQPSAPSSSARPAAPTTTSARP